MAGLSQSRASLVRALVESAPDGVLIRLHAALAGGGDHDAAMSAVAALVAVEVVDRRMRDEVFAPVAPLFADCGLTPSTLRMIWAGLKRLAPGDMAVLSTDAPLER